MQCRDVLRYWPFALFGVLASPIVLPAFVEIEDPTATLLAGTLQALATALVGYVAYRGLVVPIETQRAAETKQVAIALHADLTMISGDIFGVLSSIDFYNGFNPPPGPYKVRFVANDNLFRAVGPKLGMLPFPTAHFVAEAYASANNLLVDELNEYLSRDDEATRARALKRVLALFSDTDKKVSRALLELLKTTGPYSDIVLNDVEFTLEEVPRATGEATKTETDSG